MATQTIKTYRVRTGRCHRCGKGARPVMVGERHRLCEPCALAVGMDVVFGSKAALLRKREEVER